MLKTGLVDRADQPDTPAGWLMKAVDRIARRGEYIFKTHAQIKQPVVDLGTRMIDVVADPFRIGVLTPVEEIAVCNVRIVFDTGLALQRSVDDRNSALRHHGMSAKNGGHIDDGDIHSPASEFQRSCQPGNAGSNNDDTRARFPVTHMRC